jgi:hypothetical protein
MLFVYLLPDKLPAPGATNRMIVMFCYNRLYRRYLHLLPALITATDGDIRWDIYPAMTTHLGSMVYNFGGLKEKPSMPFSPFLLAGSSPCRGSGRVLQRGRIAGRRFGGVSRIEAQTSLKLSIFFPELGILRPELGILRLQPVYLRLQPLHPLDEIEVILPLK